MCGGEKEPLMMAEENTPLVADRDITNQPVKPALTKTKERIMLISLLSLQFCVLSTDSFLIPFFPSIAQQKGLTQVHVGVIYSAYEMTRFIMSPVYGSQINQIGPKRMCLIGSLLVTVSCAVFGLLYFITNSTLFFVLCVAVRLIAGNGGIMVTISMTCVLLKSTSFDKNMIIGMIEMVMGAAQACGPGLGTVVYQYSSYTSAFLILAAVCAVAGLSLIFVPSVEEKESQHHSFMDTLKIPGVFILFLSLGVMKTGCIGSWTVISPVLVSQFGATLSSVGVCFVVWSVGYLAFSPAISWIVSRPDFPASRFGEYVHGCSVLGYVWSVMVISWILLLFIYLFIGPSPLLYFIFQGRRIFAVPAALMFCSYIIQGGIIIPPFQAALNLSQMKGYDGSSLKTYGIITGMINAGLGLGSMLGPLMGGVLVETVGYGWLVTIVSLSFFMMLIINGVYLSYMSSKGYPLKPHEKTIKDQSKDLNILP